MKALATITVSLLIATAHAASTRYATHCSNSKGTVKWESGSDANAMTLQKIKGGNLTLGLRQVRIEFKNETILDIQETNVCGFYSKKQVSAGRVKIVPSAQAPADLTSVSGNNEVETDVLCTYEITSHTTC